jgi:putative SOS response-associated peptidase YedK
MCGRFAQRTSAREIAKTFGVAVPEMNARYNIAPTQDVLAVRRQTEGREAIMLRWGLVPAWAKDNSMGARLINARSETVTDKPAFREAFKRRRCLIPASGFYEWQRQGTRKLPYYFQMKDGRPFAFAGLRERWVDADGAEIETCAILTTECNDLLRPVHERMPVIIASTDYDQWLDPQVYQTESLRTLLRPYPAAEMDAYPVGLHVNNPAHDDEQCLTHAP